MKSFTAVAAVTVLLVLSTVSIADPPPTLPTIPVVAQYQPCSYGVTCIFSSGFGDTLVFTPMYMPPESDSIPSDDGSGERLIATCTSLVDRANLLGCSWTDPRPAPFHPSSTQGAWIANGCGDGSWRSSLADAAIRVASLFTGNLNSPLPGVSFESPCNSHDSCYYMFAKGTCDQRLRVNIRDNVCAYTSAFLRGQCLALADVYYAAVNELGQSAYDSDHRDMECAKILKTLANDDCVRS